jgi:glycosyltransferase involved in cell wall biosynthesis
MRVAWDARVLCQPELRGIGTYAANLLTAIRRSRPALELLLFHDEGFPGVIDGVRTQRIGPSRGYRWQLWERFGLPVHAFVSRSDVLHSVANTTPPRALTPRVVTVHDVIPYLPDFAAAPWSSYGLDKVSAPVGRAAAIITDSECSREDIHRVFGIPRERVVVVPLAVDPAFRPPPEDERTAILTQYGIRQPYVLALGAPARRKNTRGTLRAFRHIARQRPDVRLVLTGVAGPFEKVVRQMVTDSDVPSDRVVLTPFVDRDVLAALYAEAEVFLFLTLYEGFGLPILEAFKCGAPVVCSSRASCPEVAGDAAAIVDPADEVRAAEVVISVMHRSANERQVWRSRAQERERCFSWTRTAEMTLAVYDAVAAN